jgi:hypothetical protein
VARPPAAKPRRKAGPAALPAPPAQPLRLPEPAAIPDVSLNQEVDEFTTADRIAIGDLEIRKNFANRVMLLFAITNLGALFGLALVFWQDCAQLAAHLTKPADRIIDGKVIMALLGATTVQLGTVIYTITRAIFPTHSDPRK